MEAAEMAVDWISSLDWEAILQECIEQVQAAASEIMGFAARALSEAPEVLEAAESAGEAAVEAAKKAIEAAGGALEGVDFDEIASGAKVRAAQVPSQLYLRHCKPNLVLAFSPHPSSQGGGGERDGGDARRARC